MARYTLVGSGPSASKSLRDKKAWMRDLAVVNGAIKLYQQEDVDLYFVCENLAVRMYWDYLVGFHPYSIYMKMENYISTFANIFDGQQNRVIPPVNVIGEHFGPPELRDLLPDRTYPEGRETWISSGVMALWVLASYSTTREIVVYGLDGFEHADDYDPKLKDAILDRYKENTIPAEREHPNVIKDDRWKHRMNAHMSEAIERITNYYKNVKFIWYNKPRHYNDKWNVEIMKG